MRTQRGNEINGSAETVQTIATPVSLSVTEFEAHVKQCQLQSFTFDYYIHGVVEEVGEVFDTVRFCRGAIRGLNVLELGP